MNLLKSFLSSDRNRVWTDFAKSRNGVFVSRPLDPLLSYASTMEGMFS